MGMSPFNASRPSLRNTKHNGTHTNQQSNTTLPWRSRYPVYKRSCSSVIRHSPQLQRPISASLCQCRLYMTKTDKRSHRSTHSADRLLFNMATPHFEPLQNNDELLAVIDVVLRSFADKSEQRIELIPGGKYSCRLNRVLALFFYCDL